MRPLRAFAEAFANAQSDLLQRPLFSLLSIAAMAAATFGLAAFLFVSQGARDVFGRLADQAVLEVYLRPSADEAAVKDLVAALSRRPAARRVERVDPDLALAEFARLYPDLADIRSLLGDNPLPASVRVTPRGPDPGAVAELVNLARASKATLSVRYDREWLESLARLGEALRLSGLAGALILLLAALVTVGSVIRLALDDKLDEVALLRLVGAPVHFILAPVLLGGAMLGAAGAVLAVFLVAISRTTLLNWSAPTPLGGMFAAVIGRPPALGQGLALVVVGAAAGAIAAGVAAGRTAFK